MRRLITRPPQNGEILPPIRMGPMLDDVEQPAPSIAAMKELIAHAFSDDAVAQERSGSGYKLSWIAGDSPTPCHMSQYQYSGPSGLGKAACKSLRDRYRSCPRRTSVCTRGGSFNAGSG